MIVVAGTIAAGKTTLARQLSEHLGVPAYLERPERNPFFNGKTTDQLASEVWFLTESRTDLARAQHSGGILERGPDEHVEVFGRIKAERGELSPAEFALLQANRGSTIEGRPPDLLIYLEIGVREALRRIVNRARPEEAELDEIYLAELASAYESFIRGWTASPVLRVFSEELDFRESDDVALVAQDIQAVLSGQLPTSLQAGAYLPTRGHATDAGLDLAALHGGSIPPLSRAIVKTGVSVHIPEGHVGFIAPRSSLAAKYGVTQLDSPGVIDAGYRADVHLLLFNTSTVENFNYARGQRLAQLVVVPVRYLAPQLVSTLTPSSRQGRGLGSTGAFAPHVQQ